MAERWSFRKLDAILGREIDFRSVVPLRVAAGVLTIIHLRPFLASAMAGSSYEQVFTIPYWWGVPRLPDGLYVIMLWAGIAAAAAMAVGIFTRVATPLAAFVVIGNLALSQTHYHNNRAFLAAILLALTVMPVGERLSLDRLRQVRPRHGRFGWGPQWPLLLLRLQVAVVYTTSGTSKLLDGDWFGGVVTRLRVERQLAGAAGAGPPQWLVDVVRSAAFHSVFAKVVVLTEIFIGLGLLFPVTRWAAVWLAIPFHVAIELGAGVEVFSYAALAALVIWVRPVPAQCIVRVRSTALMRALRLLDWTGRLQVEVEEVPGVMDDGVSLRGGVGVLRIMTLLPITFWFAAPIWWLHALRTARGQAPVVSSPSRS